MAEPRDTAHGGIDIPVVTILGVSIHQLTRCRLLQLLEERHRAGICTWIVTANAELIMRAAEDKAIAATLAQADLRLADGAGVVWAAQHLGGRLPERLPGVEIAEDLMAWAAAAQAPIFMLGAAPGVAQEAAARLQSKYPGLRVLGCRHGYYGQSQEEAIIQEIKNTAPVLLLVALGAPRQEFWLARHFAELGVGIAIGVGGSFDVWSGRSKRAPAWMGRWGLEWLYRLAQEPRRAKRMLALPRFVWHVWREGRQSAAGQRM